MPVFVNLYNNARIFRLIVVTKSSILKEPGFPCFCMQHGGWVLSPATERRPL